MFAYKKEGGRPGFKTTASVLVFFVFCLMPFMCAAFEQHDAHVHGVAHLDVAIDGHEIVLELASPAANIVGFEHAPSNSKDRKKVKEAVALLKDGNSLFVFPGAAACKLEHVEVESELMEPDVREHRLSEKHHDHDHKHKHSDDHKESHHEHKHELEKKHSKEHAHSDFHAEYKFHIGHPEKLKSFEVLLLKQFPGIEHLEVQLLAPTGQTNVELTGDKKIIAW